MAVENHPVNNETKLSGDMQGLRADIRAMERRVLGEIGLAPEGAPRAPLAPKRGKRR